MLFWRPHSILLFATLRNVIPKHDQIYLGEFITATQNDSDILQGISVCHVFRVGRVGYCVDANFELKPPLPMTPNLILHMHTANVVSGRHLFTYSSILAPSSMSLLITLK